MRFVIVISVGRGLGSAPSIACSTKTKKAAGQAATSVDPDRVST
ncbi:hypothetical protein [Mesorhizobium sp.]|nr:hypothetical protein [Mesorhizobium sp.]